MNARNVAWLVAGAAALTSFAYGDTPTPAPAASPTPTPAAQVATPAAPSAPAETQSSPAPPAAAPTTASPTAPATASPADPTLAAPAVADQTTTLPMAPVASAPVVVLPDPIPGDSVTTVLAALGKPNGVITLPDKYLMMFNRGNVVVSLQDVVLETRLEPLAQYTAQLAEQVAAQNDARDAQARANALLDLLLNDPNYVAMTTRDRLLALARFDREHPGSDAHQNYLDLLAVYAAEQAGNAKVAEFQNQAAAARAQAIVAQQQAANVAQQLQLAQQQTAAAQQQTAAAQQQVATSQTPPVVQQTGVVILGNTGGGLHNGGPGQRPPVINNNTITNVPPQGLEVILPNGTIKYIPGSATSGGNHTTYF